MQKLTALLILCINAQSNTEIVSRQNTKHLMKSKGLLHYSCYTVCLEKKVGEMKLNQLKILKLGVFRAGG